MIYVLHGTEEVLIEKFINEYIKENKVEEIIKYDLTENTIEEVIDDASYFNIFNTDKLIIVKNSDFLTSTSKIETDSLERYVENQNPSSTIFFITLNDKLDDRKKINKLLKETSIIKTFNKLTGYALYKYVEEEFKKDRYEIGEEEIKKIISLLNEEASLMDNEIEKLKIYKLNDKTITLEDVKNVVSSLPEDNVFKLNEAVLQNDKEKMFSIYKDLLNNGEEPIKIVVLLANQFRLYYQVKILTEAGFNHLEIEKMLYPTHPYRIKLAINDMGKYREDTLIEILEKLMKIDEDIKINNANKDTVLENFFLEL